MNGIRNLAEALADNVETARDYMNHTIKDVTKVVHRAEDLWDDAQFRSLEAARNARIALRSHPLKFLGLSVVAGVVIGALVRMRRRD
jgi:ElaB/YqjD/DUF883 family membrane-anchored ribosome-binding protein